MSSAPLSSTTPPDRPFLVPQRPAAAPARSPLALWHLLSLDAPTVAATWTVFLAWCAGVRISRLDPLAMFLAVWMLYAADRLLDAKPLFSAPSALHLEARHHFHHLHRDRFLQAIVLASLPLVLLLHRTADSVLHLYILLASLLGAWLLLIHARSAPSAQQHRLPKEIAVGIFFPAAVFIPTVARAPALRSALLPAALCFAGICTLNCLFLYTWEHPGNLDEAHPSTRFAVRHLQALALTVSALAALLSFFSRHTLPPHLSAALLACASAGAALLLLHRSRRRMHPVTLRALADLCLLTPLPVAAVYVLLSR